MQEIVESPIATVVDQVVAKQAINIYLSQTLGEAYKAGKGRQMPNGDWRFLVVFHSPELKRPWTSAVVHVDGQSGLVLPLTDEQCQEARERALIAVAESQGKLPSLGRYVPRVFARRRANLYLSDTVGFFLTPIDGTFVPLDPPVWQFPIQFRLPQSGDMGVLGTIDVDAKTGEVMSLTASQITEIQRRANAIARYQTQPAAA